MGPEACLNDGIFEKFQKGDFFHTIWHRFFAIRTKIINACFPLLHPTHLTYYLKVDKNINSRVNQLIG